MSARVKRLAPEIVTSTYTKYVPMLRTKQGFQNFGRTYESEQEALTAIQTKHDPEGKFDWRIDEIVTVQTRGAVLSIKKLPGRP